MKDRLTVVDIANFCLLVDKYKTYMEEAGIKMAQKNNEMFLSECSKSISDQLKIMDDCQKLLYKFGYKKRECRADEESKRYVSRRY